MGTDFMPPACRTDGESRECLSDGWEWGSRSVIAVTHETVTREHRKQAMEQKRRKRLSRHWMHVVKC